MQPKKILQIALLNTGIAAVNIILFSKGLIGIEIGGNSALITAFGVTEVLMSIIVFGFGNYKIIQGKEIILPATEIRTKEDCLLALKQNVSVKTFTKDIASILEQTDRFSRKGDTIRDILLQKFDSGEMSFKKFDTAIQEVENVFYLNIRSVLNRINAFDEVDYNQLKSGRTGRKLSQNFIDEKMNVYGEYISFVDNAVEDNEEILLKLDKLLLEISKFNSLEDGEIDGMSAMKEIDELINKTRYYK